VVAGARSRRQPGGRRRGRPRTVRAVIAASGLVTCAACGARFDREAWAALALAERIEPREVGRLLLNWPERLCIEVRSCSRCGGPIAAKSPVSRPCREPA
jgi:hypothetical protein